jgi:uncharacterized membrane protein
MKKILKEIKENRFAREAIEINHDLFVNFLIVYLLLLLIETVWEGSVSSRIRLNYLLLLIIITGVVSILSREEAMEARKPVTAGKTDYILAGVMGIAGGVIVWYKTQNIGALSYIISATSGILIILLSILILEED